jgi:hypothetical protein
MIRHSKGREEFKKEARITTDERECQSRESDEMVTGIFDDGDGLDPADFFDPQDLPT